MSSTRNRNCPGDYRLEQQIHQLQRQYMSYDNSPFYGVSTNTQLAGFGVVGMKAAHRILSENFCDIETQLFGIGSTNLVDPKPEVIPNIYEHSSWDLVTKIPTIIPANEPTPTNQRHMFLN